MNRPLTSISSTISALQKVYFLFMAGYKHEVVACALQAGKRLVNPIRMLRASFIASFVGGITMHSSA
jgi:hypothetical protein